MGGRQLTTRSTQLYVNEKGAGQINSDSCHYSQCVVIGNVAELSGQGGWDNDNNCDYDIETQVKHAFENVDRVLQAAGFRGWEDVYKLRSYHCNIAESFPLVVEALRKRIPGHRPVWTSIEVPRLAFPPMQLELEVTAIKQK